MDEDRARELLQRERERIERSLADVEEVADPEPSQSPADEATELHDREVEAGLAERLRDDLAAIERAEERLEQGTYGVSVESGKPIPDGRLEAIPWAERTAEEEARREAHG
jgi:RNA polymerase-binding transcription factor